MIMVLASFTAIVLDKWLQGSVIMTDTTSKTLQLISQFADTAHEIVDQLKNNAVSIESIIGQKAEQTSDSIKSGISREASELEKYVDENPEISAMIAFAIGVAGARFLKSTVPGEATSGVDTQGAKTSKVA